MNIAVVTGSTELDRSFTAFFAAAPCTFYKDILSVPHHADAVIDLDFSYSEERMDALRSLLPRTILVNSVLHTLNELHAPFIRFNGWPGLMNINALEIAVDENNRKHAQQLFDQLKWNNVVCPDVAGFIVPRVVCMIINEAYFAFGEGVSSKNEIDVAMKLGTNYPYGPFEWSRLIGVQNVYALLKKLSATDARYTPAPELEKEINNG